MPSKATPFSPNFKKNSKVITLNNPTWRIPDSIYNRKLGNYSTKKSKVSMVRLKSKLISRKREQNLLKFILLDDPLFIKIDKFEFKNSQSFSFSLVKNNSLISTSKCKISSKPLAKKKAGKNRNNSTFSLHSNNGTRQRTNLVCAITHNKKLWEFTLTSYKNKTETHLKSEHLSYEVKVISNTGFNFFKMQNRFQLCHLLVNLKFG